ncbi:zinc-dependent alcohol dehydrogenase [Agathobaculum sp.]|uniref:zinc-dependent alcohol dehydrogenase n=1 Tax=Agathobaculum sp. TaxID=2048138 RepID=UPI002A7F1B96|nr:alcohol dehydrogenase catalytic domain-containing protein [Agathobaculum sp.]MDY3618481.1 alcohol dehydrogenase catalytic domain-containing protein [Agathobaculum sp.]
MKKLLWTDVNKLELVEAPIPEPGPGQAVVRVKYAGICGSDLHIYAGQHPTAKPPLVIGHEACGELYAINADRTDLKVGDKVCSHTIEPCNACEGCHVGRENLCTNVKIMGTSMDGVFTQYLLCNAERLIKFNDDVDMQIAALVEPLTVAVHDTRRAGIRPGEDVFIAGAGTIGILIGMMCKLAGAAHVVLAELNPDRIRIAKELGFEVVDISASDFAEQCMAKVGGKYDKIFEATGFQGGFDACLSMIKQGSTMVQVGMPPKGTIFNTDINAIIYNEAELLGVRHHTMTSMEGAAKIINAGLLNDQLAKVVSAVYPVEKSMEAFEKARTDKSMLKVLIDFS